MTERLWGHDAIRIEVPYAVAKILANPDNGDRPALIEDLTQALTVMLTESSLVAPSPMVVILDGVLADGDDLSVGPCVYLRKVFINDVVRHFTELREELGL